MTQKQGGLPSCSLTCMYMVTACKDLMNELAWGSRLVWCTTSDPLLHQALPGSLSVEAPFIHFLNTEL